MTTTTRVAPPTEVGAAAVLRRAAAAEWSRLWTLRSTWWAVAAGSGLLLFVGAMAGATHDGLDPAPIWQPGQIAIVPAQFAFLLVAVLAVTGEYSTGAMRSTLQWVPKRGLLMIARTLVPVGFVTACAVVAAAATALVTWAFLGGAAEVVAGDIVASLGRVALAVAFGSLLTVGLGLLHRSTAGTLTALFLLLFVLVVTLGNAPVPWLVAISDRLPGRAVVGLMVEGELAASTIATVMAGWSVAAMVVGGWSLTQRDTV